MQARGGSSAGGFPIVTIGTLQSVLTNLAPNMAASISIVTTNPDLSSTNIQAAIDEVYTKSVSATEKSATAVAGKIPVYNGSAQLVGNITGNAVTATTLATSRTISLTGDASGSASFNGGANAGITVTLANSGVTAGTYPKVTVDAKGRVTAGAAMVAADVPSLDWSKITTGKPTTLAGYGITDAAPLGWVNQDVRTSAAPSFGGITMNGKLNLNTAGGRLVLPVGVDKWAT